MNWWQSLLTNFISTGFITFLILFLFTKVFLHKMDLKKEAYIDKLERKREPDITKKNILHEKQLEAIISLYEKIAELKVEMHNVIKSFQKNKIPPISLLNNAATIKEELYLLYEKKKILLPRDLLGAIYDIIEGSGDATGDFHGILFVNLPTDRRSLNERKIQELSSMCHYWYSVNLETIDEICEISMGKMRNGLGIEKDT